MCVLVCLCVCVCVCVLCVGLILISTVRLDLSLISGISDL